MKNLVIAVCLLLFAAVTACDKKEAKPAENPITTLLTEEAQTLKTIVVRENSFREMGVVFSSSAKGNITQLGSKLPDAGIYIVTLWDFDSKKVLLQKTIEQEIPDKLELVDTEVVQLEINKKYLISINNRSGQRPQGPFTQVYKASGGDVLPATRGNITMHGSRTGSGSTVTFPTSSGNQYSIIYGFPEFTFVPD
jgi:hypothetical protein